jgi:hypothetical protein
MESKYRIKVERANDTYSEYQIPVIEFHAIIGPLLTVIWQQWIICKWRKDRRPANSGFKLGYFRIIGNILWDIIVGYCAKYAVSTNCEHGGSSIYIQYPSTHSRFVDMNDPIIRKLYHHVAMLRDLPKIRAIARCIGEYEYRTYLIIISDRRAQYLRAPDYVGPRIDITKKEFRAIMASWERRISLIYNCLRRIFAAIAPSFNASRIVNKCVNYYINDVLRD